jgi:NADH:ubiquinone oxidoreductase subunit C
MTIEEKQHPEAEYLFNIVNPALTKTIAASYIAPTILTLAAYRQTTIELATYIKLSSIFKATNPLDCYVVDSIESKYRFSIVYTIQSMGQNTLIRIVTKTNDTQPLISLQSIYPSFNWAEREIWDMSGVFFIKHPDLRRILTDYGFIGHPLRKDFPLSGFKEVHYEDSTKAIEYTALELSQSYRVSNLLNPWN